MRISDATFELYASTSVDLKRQLAAIDISVPLQTEGRTSRHRERYMMARLLANTADTEFLTYPLRVEHREKPDFALHMSSRSIGVECVEATSTEWAQIQSIRERDFPEALIFLPMMEPGKTKFSLEQRLEIARGDRAGPPWAGNMAVKQWAVAQASFIDAKTAKLRAGNYDEFEERWLLIQDEWPVPMHHREDYEEAIKLCASKIESLLVPPCFTRIFIADSSWMIEMTPGPPRIRAIDDLWR